MKAGDLVLGTLLGAAVVGGIFLITRKAQASVWQVGDTLWCEAHGDPGPFYIVERRQVDGSWEYHIWEGTPGRLLEDLGWFTEDYLLAAPMTCTLY